MTNLICAICGKKQKIKVLYRANFKESDLSSEVYSARRLPDRIHYQTLKCENCGLIFSSPILPLSKIASLYRKSVCSYDEQISYTTKTYVDIFKKIEKNTPKNPKVLDIGCGNGFFLDALTKIGINNVYGVEPSLKMAVQASKKIRNNIKVDIFKPNQFPDNFFNVISCFHTLDHVTDPNKFIRSTWNALAPGGYALFVVHNTDSIFAKIFGERWPIFDIEHIYLFNPNTLTSLFSKYKFKDIRTFNVKNVYPLSYYAKMVPLPAGAKNMLITVIDKLKLSSIELPLISGNIGIIAQK